MRRLYPSFRRFLFAIGAFTVCMLALAGFAADALGVDGFSATGRHRTLVARAEEPALAFIVAVGCLITASSALRGNRRKPVPDEAQVRQLAAQARTDSLTGLGNHRAFEENLSATIAARASTGAPFVLLALDVDGLKEINDTHGHLAGDTRIKLVANCLRETVASSGTVHRTGGDEFMVILPGCRNWHGLELARTIDESTRAATGGRTVSIGLTESVGTEGRHLLVGQADLALYEAKRTRLNAVVFNAGLATTDDSPRLGHGPSRDQRALAAALARAVDAKDVGTQSHSETVAQLCVAIAERLAIAGERLERIRIAGLLHDVGKIGVADAILQKPGALDSHERRAMDDHVEVGHGIITAAELFEEAEWVLHHHERYDGTGYPAKQRAGEIPLESRIIAVADAFEAMTSDRPYRNSVTDEEALSELRAHAGTQFDGRCVNALVEVVSESEVAKRVDRRSVDAHLEVEVRPEAVPRAADVADHLALADGLTH